MKTFNRTTAAWIVMFGVSATTLLGFSYYEDAPFSAAGDASMLAFESGGQFSADELTREFGTDETASVQTAGISGSTETAPPAQSIDIEVGGGSFNLDGQEGEIYTVKIPYSRRMTERGTLQVTIPLSAVVFDDVLITDDAQVYGIGLNAGYAWQAFLKKDNVPYRWKITPSAGLFYRDSTDLKLGSWVFNTGLSSSFAWQFSPGWVVNMGNSVSFAWNNGIKNYPDPVRDDQQTLVNGLQLYRMLDRWTFGVYVTDTQALNDMQVDSYQGYGVTAAYQLTKSRSLRFSFVRETGNGGYSSSRGLLGSTWSF